MITLSSAELVALGGTVGAALMKLFDVLLSRRKNDLDAANARLAAVNEANAQLIRSLFQHIETLKSEVADVHRRLIICDEQHQKGQEEINKLRSELAQVKSTIKLN